MNILTFESREIEFDILNISDYRAKHLIEVIKVVVGQEIRVGQIGASTGNARVESINQGHVCLKLLKLENRPTELEVDLLVAMPRPQTLKKILELAGCFSINRLTLVNTSKVENSYFSSSVLNGEQIKKHLILGMQQGIKTKIPEVLVSKDFFSTVSQVKNSTKIVAHNHDSILMNKINFDKSSRAIFAFGPEGGWTEAELEHFTNCGFTFLNLSSAVLRLENAVCAALSQYELMQSGAS